MVAGNSDAVGGGQIVRLARRTNVRPLVTIMRQPIDDGRHDLPIAFLGCLGDLQKRSQPSWIACRVIENAPVMIDWLGR